MLPSIKHFTPSRDALKCRNSRYITVFLPDTFAVETALFSQCILFIKQSRFINTDNL